MDLTKAFLFSDVEVSRPESASALDHYRVTGVKGGVLRLMARRADLRGDPPAAGASLLVRAPGEEVREVRIRVLECSVGERLVLVSGQQDSEVTVARRRRAVRAPVHMPVRVEAVGGETWGPIETVTEDAGVGGIRVVATEALSQGCMARVILEPGDGEGEMAFSAGVVHCRPTADGLFEIGLRFHDPRAQDLDRIVYAVMKHRAEERARMEALLVGRVVQVCREAREGGEYHEFRVVSVRGSRLKLVGTPGFEVRRNQELLVRYVDESAVYDVAGRVVGLSEHRYLVLTVQQMGEFRRVQRRQYVRVPTPGVTVELKGEFEGVLQAAVENLSGGGALVVGVRPLSVNSEVSMKLHLAPDRPPVACTARVAWQAAGEGGTARMGMQFKDIEPRDRERIIKLCMAELRRRLREKRQAGPAK